MRRYQGRRGCWRPADGSSRETVLETLAKYPVKPDGVSPYGKELFRYLMNLADRAGMVSGYTETSLAQGLNRSSRSVRLRMAELKSAGMVTVARAVEARPGAFAGQGLGPNGYQLQPPSAWVLRLVSLSDRRPPPYTDSTGSTERDAAAAEDARLEMARERMRAVTIPQGGVAHGPTEP